MAVAAILAAIAAPNLQRFLQKQAVTANADLFMSSIRMARAEAMKRALVVTVCPISNPDDSAEANSPVCPAQASSWANGWKVTDGTTVISVRQQLSQSGTVTPASAGISFQPSGLAMGAQSSFVFNPRGNDTSVSKTICIASTGRARVC